MNNLTPYNIMGLKIQIQKCACGSNFVKVIWKPLFELGHQALLSTEIIREQRDAEAKDNLL